MRGGRSLPETDFTLTIIEKDGYVVHTWVFKQGRTVPAGQSMFAGQCNHARGRTQAEAEGWIGEIEDIDLTLTFLRAERDETQRLAQRPAVHLCIPARRRPQESG
ncbi:hypothetical protein [Streptomyces lavendofoliae]|uniref:Uncharacterized protein n=1 Tax=Streptomyces lavendofoliae TaxID=67314 RepID=A0A918M2D9_9ACTN|nr:hypothetical protein [Streptomyces lavendofoliae]GGU24761.1 hypothetical protein GCM10010274_09220 [Streptomyces lavendofoliae]